jgi:hypothetical protein
MSKGMYFIIRLKRNVYVNGKPLWKLGSGVYENVLVHKIFANVFVRGYIYQREEKRISMLMFQIYQQICYAGSFTEKG